MLERIIRKLSMGHVDRHVNSELFIIPNILYYRFVKLRLTVVGVASGGGENSFI